MRWATCAERSKKNKYYIRNPYWYAWYPVVAADGENGNVWVWREVVRVERQCVEYRDHYGGVGKGVKYFYKTIPPEKLPQSVNCA